MTLPIEQGAGSKREQLDQWRCVLAVSARQVFKMMAGVELADPREMPLRTCSEVAGMVGLAGQLCGVVTIRCGRAAAVKIACHMLGAAEQEAAPQAIDAVGEVCNMVAGDFKAKIGLDDKCMLSVPTVISGDNYEFHSLAADERIELSLSLEGHPIWFSLQVRR